MAMTAKDVQELRQEVMNEDRNVGNVRDYRDLIIIYIVLVN